MFSSLLASQLHSGAVAEVVKGKTEPLFAKNVHWRRGISDISNFKALAWRFTVIVMVHRPVADDAVRTVTKPILNPFLSSIVVAMVMCSPQTW